ncbi:MAG TPA: RNA polymerase subunit sigma-70, partial [Cytophagales bacterium]|nr:RNA polymerase subunit sigma-70 [Cytophagales bacterium]
MSHRGLQKNNREAQSKLYDLLATKLFSVCLPYSRNREEAKDLLQESFVKIFQNIGNFNGDGSFEGWCRRIATNTS